VIALREAAIGIDGRILIAPASATFESGTFVAILGAIGVAKTTLLRVLAGALRPASGEVRLAGEDPASFAPVERARRIAFVTSDDAPVEGLTAREVAASGRYPFHRWWQWREDAADEAAVAAALNAVGMSAFAERRFETLSSGERQRIWIALALAQEAPVLLLDEPTSHLDVRVAHEILQLLREQARAGRTIVCAMHDLNDAATYADRMMLLGDGRMLAFDAPARVFTAGLLERAYGVPMEIVRAASGAPRAFAIGDASAVDPAP
jgi:ABC-type cobalamin/Fe3+-siderophores transport system ATPase subunit